LQATSNKMNPIFKIIKSSQNSIKEQSHQNSSQNSIKKKHNLVYFNRYLRQNFEAYCKIVVAFLLELSSIITRPDTLQNYTD